MAEGVSAGLLDSDYERMIAHGLDLPPYTRLAEVFGALIRGRGTVGDTNPPAATFEDGLRSLAVLEACRESARAGGWVTCDH